MDRARGLGRHMAGDTARKRKLRKQPSHALRILRNVRVELGVRALQVRVGHKAWPAVAWTGDVDHVQVALLDDPVAMDVDEVQSRSGAPMPEQARLDVFELQRLG